MTTAVQLPFKGDGELRTIDSSATAEAWLVKVRWPEGVHCAYCGSPDVKRSTRSRVNPFLCAECSRYCGVRTGTVISYSKVSYLDWVMALYQMTVNEGLTERTLGKAIGVSQKSGIYLFGRIRVAWAETSGGAPIVGASPVDVARAVLRNQEMLCMSCSTARTQQVPYSRECALKRHATMMRGQAADFRAGFTLADGGLPDPEPDPELDKPEGRPPRETRRHRTTGRPRGRPRGSGRQPTTTKQEDAVADKNDAPAPEAPETSTPEEATANWEVVVGDMLARLSGVTTDESWRTMDDRNLARMMGDVIGRFRDRQQLGQETYGRGHTFKPDPLDELEQEQLDALFYTWCVREQRDAERAELARLREIIASLQ